jgi:hypothetical protein
MHHATEQVQAEFALYAAVQGVPAAVAVLQPLVQTVLPLLLL